MELQQGKAQAPVADESNILERVARLISSVRGVKPDYAHLAAELEPALPFDLFGIVLLRYDRQAVRVTVCERTAEHWVARYHQLPLADSMVERVSRQFVPDREEQARTEAGGGDGSGEQAEKPGAGLLVERFPDGASGLPAQCGDALCGHPQLQAILVAPLIAGGNMLGTLELGSVCLDAYNDPALQRLIHAIASVLATAIEGAQVGGNVEIQDRQRAELKDVSTVLTTAVDLPMILNRIVTGITNVLHVSSAIVRLEGRQRSLSLAAQSGLDSVLLQRVLRQENVTSQEAIIGATLLRRQSQVSQDITQDEHFPLSRAFASVLTVRSLFCYPLIAGQYVYGALLLLSPEPGGFTPLKTDIFSLFAGQATVAIHNGLLLQSAQERRRFQEVIEQFERSSQRNVFDEQDEPGEQEVLARLRAETMNTFGVSLGSVLRFISDHLLSRSERHLQDILRSSHVPAIPGGIEEVGAFGLEKREGGYSKGSMFLTRISEIEDLEHSAGSEGTAFLMQVADTALAHTDFLRDISAAVMRVLHIDEAQPQAYEHLRRELAEPWFIVDLDGRCVYLNRAAEQFCELDACMEGVPPWGMWPEERHALFSSFRPLSVRQQAPLMLEQALASLLPRARHIKEVLAYLREFTVSPAGQAEQEEGSLPAFLRCTLAAEPLAGQMERRADSREPAGSWSSGDAPQAVIAPPAPQRTTAVPTMPPASSPSDHHYQFVRHALYNEAGHWFANALHVRDITEQVRDEKNKAVLLASVSHDLRTPLTTIKAAVTGLLQPDVVWDEDMRREILEDIDAEADHLHTLVNALVEMSRIEMGALILDKEWCDIVELIYNTLNRAQRLLVDFTVQTQVQSSLPLIHADYAQLERVLYNLLENATRHSPRHTQIHITVDMPGAHALPQGMPEAVTRGVRVCVSDQGPGIPEEERERVFQSFYSLDAQGNGLGLAICRGIIEAHQGRIWVETEEGRGASFVFVLPIAS
jgi:signal transduction histidine kinase/GAF domain-containing protein